MSLHSIPSFDVDGIFSKVIEYLEYLWIALHLYINGVKLVCILQVFLEVLHPFNNNFLLTLKLSQNDGVIFVHDVDVDVFHVVDVADFPLLHVVEA